MLPLSGRRERKGMPILHRKDPLTISLVGSRSNGQLGPSVGAKPAVFVNGRCALTDLLMCGGRKPEHDEDAMKKLALFLGSALIATVPAGEALAQWNNAPYGAGVGTSGFSMSNAHRQVILDQRAGTLPDGQVYRDRTGNLLVIERGDDNQAIVRDRAGVEVRIPRGRTWQGRGFGYGGRDSSGFGSGSTTGDAVIQTSYVASTDLGNHSLAISQTRSGSAWQPGVSSVAIWTEQLAAMAN